MPKTKTKYYCELCDVYVNFDSPSTRKLHNSGRKHKNNVEFYYLEWMEEQAQNLLDTTMAALRAAVGPGGQIQHMDPMESVRRPKGPPL